MHFAASRAEEVEDTLRFELEIQYKFFKTDFFKF